MNPRTRSITKYLHLKVSLCTFVALVVKTFAKLTHYRLETPTLWRIRSCPAALFFAAEQHRSIRTPARNMPALRACTPPKDWKGCRYHIQHCYMTVTRECSPIAGYEIHDLADHSTLRKSATLLWFGRLPRRRIKSLSSAWGRTQAGSSVIAL